MYATVDMLNLHRFVVKRLKINDLHPVNLLQITCFAKAHVQVLNNEETKVII